MIHYLLTVQKEFFVPRPLKTMLNFEVDRLSIQHLEYEMDIIDFLVDYNCFEKGFFGHPNFPYAHIQLNQANN